MNIRVGLITGLALTLTLVVAGGYGIWMSVAKDGGWYWWIGGSLIILYALANLLANISLRWRLKRIAARGESRKM